jgi:alkylresorcinol/alkylpyrone synthase
LSTIISIGTAVPAYKHQQEDILPFMQRIYGLEKEAGRRLKFLYHQSGIGTRHSILPDYSRKPDGWEFYPPTENLEPFPSLELRMLWYRKHAAPLSLQAIGRCLEGRLEAREITHLITVSCTGMSAPGLDIELVEALGLSPGVFRTSINFMGCYAAIHALRLAHALVAADPAARALIVCTELCTLHFQRQPTPDNIMSSLLFADGSAAALVVPDGYPEKGVRLKHFYSELAPEGKKEMSWDLSSTGFKMTLSNYVPDLIGADFATLVSNALKDSDATPDRITHWCIHPGGKKILDAIAQSLSISRERLGHSYEVLEQFGNMSSPTVLFVLQRMLAGQGAQGPVFGAAFGPGLTMETFIGEIH